MKTKLLSLCFFLASTLVAEESPPIIDTPLPADIKMDQLKHIRKQLSEAREKGWDIAPAKKEQPQRKPKTLIEFNLSSAPPNFQPMQKSKSPIEFNSSSTPPNFQPMRKSEQMMSVFRNDVPEAEKGMQMDRLNEADRKFKYPGKK